jgi:hypothetical protein
MTPLGVSPRYFLINQISFFSPFVNYVRYFLAPATDGFKFMQNLSDTNR